MWGWFKKASGITAIISAVATVAIAVSIIFFPPTWPIYAGIAIGAAVTFFSGGVYLGNNQQRIDEANQRHQQTEVAVAANIDSIRANNKLKNNNMAEAVNEAKTMSDLELTNATLARLETDLKAAKTTIQTLQENRDADRLANARQNNSFQQQINQLSAQRGTPNATPASGTNNRPTGANPASDPSSIPNPRHNQKPTRPQGTPSATGLFAAANHANIDPSTTPAQAHNNKK